MTTREGVTVLYKLNDEGDTIIIKNVRFETIPQPGSALQFGDFYLKVDWVIHNVPSNFKPILDESGNVVSRKALDLYMGDVVRIICNAVVDLHGNTANPSEFAQHVRTTHNVLIPHELKDFLDLTYGMIQSEEEAQPAQATPIPVQPKKTKSYSYSRY